MYYKKVFPSNNTDNLFAKENAVLHVLHFWVGIKTGQELSMLCLFSGNVYTKGQSQIISPLLSYLYQC